MARQLRLVDVRFPEGIDPIVPRDDHERRYAVIVGFVPGVYNKLDMLCTTANVPEALVFSLPNYAAASSRYRSSFREGLVRIEGTASVTEREAFELWLRREIILFSEREEPPPAHVPRPPSPLALLAADFSSWTLNGEPGRACSAPPARAPHAAGAAGSAHIRDAAAPPAQWLVAGQRHSVAVLQMRARAAPPSWVPTPYTPPAGSTSDWRPQQLPEDRVRHGRYPWYVVWKGRRPGIYKSWGDATESNGTFGSFSSSGQDTYASALLMYIEMWNAYEHERTIVFKES